MQGLSLEYINEICIMLVNQFPNQLNYGLHTNCISIERVAFSSERG